MNIQTMKFLLEQTEREMGRHALRLVGRDPRGEVQFYICPPDFAPPLGKRAKRRPSIWGPGGIAG